jgi:hypothetical protein
LDKVSSVVNVMDGISGTNDGLYVGPSRAVGAIVGKKVGI